MSLKFVLQSAALICACSVASAAGPAQSAASGVLACRGIADNTARLACFDRESAQLAAMASSTMGSPTASSSASSNTSTAAAGAPAFGPSSAAASSLDPQQTFGLSTAEISSREVAAGKRPRDATSITAHIAHFAAGANGRYVFTLDNHQVWKQLLADGDLDSKPGDTVVISRAMLGSFWMKAQSGRGCKVTRLR